MIAAQKNRQPVTQESALSDLYDGELDVVELDRLLQSIAEDGEEARETCERYRVISDVLQGNQPGSAALAPHAFLAGVHARLAAESVPALTPAVASALVRAPAANDAVFRWKLVAGFASLAAVVAVSWGVLGGAPGTAGGVASEPQLALVEAAGLEAAAPVVVNTPQGQVLRDARLEELLAEHRQYGGMSALQMPAGFLRDATYQPAPRR